MSQSPQLTARASEAGLECQPILPVFIGACPRSGTTLLGSLLGSSSGAVCVPESQFKIGLLGLATRQRDGDLDRSTVLDFLDRDFRFGLWRLDLRTLRDSLPERGRVQDFLRSLVTLYALRTNRAGARLWIDHTPNNIRYFSRLSRVFPQARFIHLVRDPRSVAASLKPLDWGPNHSHTCATFWVQQIAHGLAAEGSLGDRIVRIHFEDLVGSPEQTLEMLCRHLHLEFDLQMLETKGFLTPSYSEHQHSLVGEPPDASRATSWQHSLTRREVELIEASACDLLGYFGYPSRFAGSPRPITGRERLSCALRELARVEVVNRWRLRQRRALGRRAARKAHR